MLRLYFYNISHEFDHGSIELVDGLKIVVEELKSDEGMMAIIALPIEKIFKSKEISYLQERDDAFIIALTSGEMTPSEIKEHQESKLGANIYFRHSLDEEKIRQAFDVFDLNEFIPEDFYEKKKIDQEEISTPPINIEDDMSDSNENDSLVFEVSTEEDSAPQVEEVTEEEEIDLDFDLASDSDQGESDTDIEMAMVDDIPEPEADGLSLDSDLETEAISLGDGDLDDEMELDGLTDSIDASEIDLEEPEPIFDKVEDETGEFEVDLTQEVEIPAPELSASDDDEFDEDSFSEFDYKTAIMPSSVREEQLAKANEGQESLLSEDLVAEDDGMELDDGDFSLDASDEISAVEEDDDDDDLFADIAPSAPSVNYSDQELSKMGGLIETLRRERDKLQEDIKKERQANSDLKRDNQEIRNECDELKVENAILRKRVERKADDFERKYELSEEKRRLLEAKLKQNKNELDKVRKEIREEQHHLKSEENDLRSKIELMEMDYASQIATREEKILELKRTLETLEFNIENMTIKNQELRKQRGEINERLRLVASSLRGSIDIIEDDQEIFSFEDDKLKAV